VATLTTGLFCATLAAILPVDLLGNLTSIGTLFAFFLVSISVIVLRITQPDLPRLFRIPGPNWLGGFLIPAVSALASLGLMLSGTPTAILRVFVWLLLGLVIYGTFGYWNSKIGKAKVADIRNSDTSMVQSPDTDNATSLP
jgi:APA family basic amino acid/polyamine antiporter